MGFYTELAAQARAILTEFGAKTTFRRAGAPTYDVSTATSTITETVANITCAVFDYPAKYIDGSKVLTGDKQVFASCDTAPQVGDFLLWQGIQYSVVTVKPLAPAGINILYEMQVRS